MSTLTTRDKSLEVWNLFKTLAELLNKQPIPAIALYSPKELLENFTSVIDEESPLEIIWVGEAHGVKAGVVDVSLKVYIKDSPTLGIAFQLTHEDIAITPKKNVVHPGVANFVSRLFNLDEQEKITYAQLLERTNAAIADYQRFYGITTS